MPSNKQRDILRKQEADKKLLAETTGSGEIVYSSIALCPVLEKNVITKEIEIVYKIMELQFTMDKKFVSMEEIDRCRTQGTALNKLQIHASNSMFDIAHLRRVAKQLKKELE